MKNQAVLNLSVRTEFENLPNSLKQAFSSIPKEMPAKEVNTIFNNVTDMSWTLKNVLKGIYFSKIEAPLVDYIQNRGMTYEVLAQLIQSFLEKTIPNKVVLKLLSERREFKNLPDTLRDAFLLIPKEISAQDPEKEIRTIFDNVTRQYEAMKNILQEKYPSKVDKFNVLLAEYIETQDVTEFKRAVEHYRNLEKGILIAEEEKYEVDQQLLQAEKLRKKNLEEAQELEALAREYASLSDPVENSDIELYKKYVEQKSLEEIKKLVTRIKILMYRRKSMIQNLETLGMFLKPNEHKENFIIDEAKKSYNNEHLDAAEKIVDELWNRKKDWEADSEAKFSAVSGEYTKLFTSNAAITQERISFETALKSNNPVKVNKFFENIFGKIKEETELRKNLQLEINTLDDLRKKINSVDFNKILGDIFTIKNEAEDLLRVPEFEEDMELLMLINDISILEDKVKKSQEKAIESAMYCDPEKLKELLNELESTKKSHIETFQALSGKLKKTIDELALPALMRSFSAKKKTVENDLNKAHVRVGYQRKRVLYISQSGVINDLSKLDEIESKREDIQNNIVATRKSVSQITLDEADSLKSVKLVKSVSDKIIKIDRHQGETADYIKEISANEAALNKISGKTMCFKSIEAILTVLIAKTEERINAYQGISIKKTILKKDQAKLMWETMKVLLGKVKRENRDGLTDKVKELCERKQEFSAIASKASFWAFLPGAHSLSYTVNDQNYNRDLDVGIYQIKELISEAEELSKSASNSR